MDNNSLAHTRWNCKYHIVFAPRRKAIYGKYKSDKEKSTERIDGAIAFVMA